MGDWSAGLLSTDTTRGLSGGAAPSVALDADNPAYNYRLRKHEAGGDLVADPRRLWEPSPDAGLAGHAAAEAVGDELPFTDVLVVLSADDHAAAASSDGWFARARDVLARQLAGWCAREGLKRRAMRRPLGVRFVRDGSDETGGITLGLTRGEYVTSLVPNLYAGPVEGSRERFVIHLALPGVWEGWREIARLYDDQALLTIGSHWLDNFSHPALREHALYRIVPGARPVHRLHPDLQDRFQLVHTVLDATPIVTVATKEGRPVCHIVVVASGAVDTGPSGKVAPASLTPKTGKRGGVPSIAPPMMVGDASEAPSRAVLPDAPSPRVIALQERGALLQKVHFGAFMLGYDVYVDRHGELVTTPDAPILTWSVRRKSLSVTAHVDGCELDHVALEVGKETEITGDALVLAGGNEYSFSDLRDIGVDGWPYVGEIRRPVSATYLPWNDAYTVGRSRECRVLLPDEPRNDNIHWKPGVADGATIRARTGDIPKSQFYTDSIMVATTHASLDLTLPMAQLVCQARQCYVYLRRDDTVLPLYPTASGAEPTRRELRSSDEVLVGNSVFQVRYPPIEPMVRPPPPPRFGTNTPPPSDTSKPMLRVITAEDTPDVGVGTLEPLPRLSPAGPDSILDMPAALPPELEAPPEPPPVAEPSAPAPEPPPAPPEPAPPPEPKPAPPPEPVVASAPPEPVSTASRGSVVSVDERAARFELGRPLHLVVSGWMAAGRFVLGNHDAADGVVPENRMRPDQAFMARDYLSVTVKGRKARAEILAPSEVMVDDLGPDGTLDDADGRTFDILRRDDSGDEDFAVRLTLGTDKALPDPRARLLKADVRDALAAALLTRGLPRGPARTLEIGGLRFDARWDGTHVTLSGYLDSYRRGDGFHPFFVSAGGGRFTTAPEDGADIVLAPGDRLVIDATVVDIRTE